MDTNLCNHLGRWNFRASEWVLIGRLVFVCKIDVFQSFSLPFCLSPMTEIKPPLKVFLYHAPADRIAARELYLHLIEDGVDARLVKEKILPGQAWNEEIHNAVREVDVVVVCISGQLVQLDSRQKEVWAALDSVIAELDAGNLIIPVRLEASEIPENLKNWQQVDLFEANGYATLLLALQAEADEIGAGIQPKENPLPQIATLRVKNEQPILEENPVEVRQERLRIIEGAGILIEDPAVKEHKPGRAILLALFGAASILMLAWFGPGWIEASSPATATAAVKATQTSASVTQAAPAPTHQPIPISTLVRKGNVSHIVFLIDTSGSMQGQRIRNVKSAASSFVSRLGGDYLVSIIEFDTNVELRMPPTRDHGAASGVIDTIAVDAEHDGSCAQDALYAGFQEAFFTQNGEADTILIVLSDVAEADHLGWSCRTRTVDASINLTLSFSLPIFSIYVGDDFLANSFVIHSGGEGTSRPAQSAKKIEETLFLIAEAAGLALHTATVSPGQTTDISDRSMVFVQAGEFLMGNNRTVHLDAFWIDKTEVTNAMYARCVQAGSCSPPRSNSSHTHESYYGNPAFDDYPVIYVSWEDAREYCSWAGGRLLTEAEWEKAARGTDGRPFPWGDADPSGVVDLLNYYGQDTTEVGSFPNGASPYGALDMAGNVSEWVADWLSLDYYNNPPASNPLGPETGEYRVWRGGSWATTYTDLVRTTSRTGNFPTDSSGGIGFRCARDVSP